MVADLKQESATIQREFTSQLELDTTFIDSRDGIITDIVAKTTQATKEITEATKLVIVNTTKGVKSLQDIKATASIDVNTHKETIVQEIHDLRDRATTQIAVFQDDLQASTIVKMQAQVARIKSKLQSDMDAYVLDHTITLQTTMTDLKQEIRTELFVDLQTEKTRLKNELLRELRNELTTTRETPQHAEHTATQHADTTTIWIYNNSSVRGGLRRYPSTS